jgi:hypothetical protein
MSKTKLLDRHIADVSKCRNDKGHMPKYQIVKLKIVEGPF